MGLDGHRQMGLDGHRLYMGLDGHRLDGKKAIGIHGARWAYRAMQTYNLVGLCTMSEFS